MTAHQLGIEPGKKLGLTEDMCSQEKVGTPMILAVLQMGIIVLTRIPCFPFGSW